MNVLIPFSGGINSTFVLWRFLSETDHDITAIYSREEWQDIEKEAGRQAREEEAVDKQAAWLKANVRDFKFEKMSWPVSYKKDLQPIRDGFTKTVNVGAIEPRYHGYKKLIEERSPDAIANGISLENTATDNYVRLRSLYLNDDCDIYLAGNRDLTPIAKGDGFNYAELAKDMMGRFEQLEKLPTDLAALQASKCAVRHDPRVNPEILCMSCLYEIVVEEVTDMTGKELDQSFAKHGSYGKWRGEADPETYMYRGEPARHALELLGIELGDRYE